MISSKIWCRWWIANFNLREPAGWESSTASGSSNSPGADERLIHFDSVGINLEAAEFAKHPICGRHRSMLALNWHTNTSCRQLCGRWDVGCGVFDFVWNLEKWQDGKLSEKIIWFWLHICHVEKVGISCTARGFLIEIPFLGSKVPFKLFRLLLHAKKLKAFVGHLGYVDSIHAEFLGKLPLNWKLLISEVYWSASNKKGYTIWWLEGWLMCLVWGANASWYDGAEQAAAAHTLPLGRNNGDVGSFFLKSLQILWYLYTVSEIPCYVSSIPSTCVWDAYKGIYGIPVLPGTS